MIKTLRITSIIVAIAATVLLILPAVYGVRSDPKTEEFIKSPGAVDKFTAAKGQGSAKKDTESPLVKEAVVYKNILNPPPPPPPKVAPGDATQTAAPPAPPVVAVKFDLVATSYYASNPEQSFVLINEPGKGLHWVKQGSAVGHLTIETVKDGAIIVRDGQRTSEMTVKVQEGWKKLLKNPPSSTSPSSSPPSPATPAVQAPTGRPGITATKPGAAPLPTQRSPIQGATPSAAERITSANQPAPPIGQPRPAETVKTPPAAAPQAAAQPPTPPPQEIPLPEDSPAVKEKAAKIDKLVSEIGTSDEITPEERKKLDEVFNQVEELGQIRDAESANDINVKDVNK